MKKTLFAIVCLLLAFNDKVYSQNESTVFQVDCWRDTTLLMIEKIEEYAYKPKKIFKTDSLILVYIIKARYVEEDHKNYMAPLVLVSMDTISIHKENKTFYRVSFDTQRHTIKEGDTYLFHLELFGCLPVVMGPAPSFFVVEGIDIPVEMCPFQPFRANELFGLNYYAGTEIR